MEKQILQKIDRFREYLEKIAKHIRDGTLTDAEYTPTHQAASLLDTEVWDYLKKNSRK